MWDCQKKECTKTFQLPSQIQNPLRGHHQNNTGWSIFFREKKGQQQKNNNHLNMQNWALPYI